MIKHINFLHRNSGGIGIKLWKCFLILLPIVTSIAFPHHAFAKEYYVAASARNGDDSCASDNGSGSLADPWGSLHYASKQLGPGDTLYIRGGVYREEYSPFGSECAGSGAGASTILKISGVSGTASAPVLIRPYANEDVVIETTPINYVDTSNEWTRCESSSTCGSCSGLSISGYTNMYYKGGVNLGSAPRAQVYVDPGFITEGEASPGQRLHYNSRGIRAGADFGTACQDINKMEPGTFSTAGGSTNQTTVYLSDGSDPDTHKIVCSSEIGACATHAVYISNSSNVRLSGEGTDGQKHMQILGGYHTVYINASDDITVDNMYVHNAGTNEYGSAIRTGSGVTDLIISSVDVQDVTAEGMALYSGGNSSCSSGNNRITVRDSRVVRTGQDIYGMKGISQTLGDGIFGKGSNAVQVLNNYVEDTQRDGITVSPSGSCQSNNWTIRGNEINNACNNPRDDECAGIALKQHAVEGTSTSKGHIVEANIVYSMSGRSGFQGVKAFRQTGYDNRFGNNTIAYNTFDARDSAGPVIHFDGTGSTLPSSMVGNILLGNSSASTVKTQSANAIGQHSHNTYWPASSGVSAQSISGGGSYLRGEIVDQWESTAVQAVPVFSSGYKLTDVAPQVDFGGDACSGTMDIFNTMRPISNGKCDVGAHELIATSGEGVTPPNPPTNLE